MRKKADLRYVPNGKQWKKSKNSIIEVKRACGKSVPAYAPHYIADG